MSAICRVIVLGVVFSMGAACGQRQLTQRDAQKAIDEWVTQRDARDGITPEFLKAHLLENEVARRTTASGRPLTDDEYTRLSEEIKPANVVKVTGVQEFPERNEATAFLDMSGFTWRSRSDVVNTYDRLTGEAHFVRYTDGRWVLAAIRWRPSTFDVREDKPNIPVR